jgi:hypothetical protein
MKKKEGTEIPDCDVCGNPIYNSDFWDVGMCGPCTTGEADTL